MKQHSTVKFGFDRDDGTVGCNLYNVPIVCLFGVPGYRPDPCFFIECDVVRCVVLSDVIMDIVGTGKRMGCDHRLLLVYDRCTGPAPDLAILRYVIRGLRYIPLFRIIVIQVYPLWTRRIRV